MAHVANVPQSYREAELGAALVADALFFLRHRDRHHRIRPALPAEIRVVQVLEHRLFAPTPGCQAVALRVAQHLTPVE